MFWAGALGVAWAVQALAFAVTGEEPALGMEAFRLIAALDLSLVVAPVALAAAWLWRRRAWGVVLAVVLHVKGVVYALLLAIGSALSGALAQGGGDGLLGLWMVFVVGSGVSLVVLLRGVPVDEDRPWMSYAGMIESGDGASSRHVDELG